MIVSSALAQAGIACWEYHLETGELWWSENAGPLFGRPAGFVPEGFAEAQRLVDPDDNRPLDLAAVVNAVEEGPVEVDRQAMWPDGTRRWTHHRYFLMTDPTGKPERLGGMMSDVDDRKRRERDDAILHHANEALMGSLDLTGTLQATADLLVPDLADWCVVELLEDGVLKPVVRAHKDPEKLKWAAAIQAEYPPDMDAALGPPNVVRTGESELFTEIPDDLLVAAVAGDERLLEILRQVGYRSVIVVPLPARNGVIGTMTLVMAESERKYDERSLRFAERLGVQMALAIETAQLYTQLSEAWHGQRLAVETLQRGLAPDPLPEITDVELAAHYEIGGAEQVGGDWYDVFENESGNVCFVIGDVVGRGVPAVASMSRYRNSLRTLLMEGHSPGHALTTLNRLNTRAGSRGAGFATVACLTYRRSDRLLSWSTAGHPPALICDVNGVRALWETAEVPLDVQPEHEYQDYSDQLRPGAMLVLYTDGLIERRGEAIDRSLQRLIDELENAPAGAKETVSHLLRVLPASPSEDDVAVLVARLH